MLRQDREITLVVTAAHVFATSVVILLFTAIFGKLFVGIPLGIIVWALVLFKTPMFEWSYFNVKPNWALIVGDQLVYDKIPDKPQDDSQPDPRVGMYNLDSMREIGPGLRGRKPGEVVYESINLQAEILISKTIRGYTKDNIPLDIDYQFVMTPLRGRLINLARKGEKTSKAFFEGKSDQHIINWLRENTEDGVFKCLADLKETFKNVNGGPNRIDEDEEEYGWFTNTPQITRVKRSAEYEKAAEGFMVGQKAGDVIEEINKSYDGHEKPDPNMVLAAATRMIGQDLKGVLLIPGLNRGGKNSAAVMATAQKLAETVGKTK